MVGRDGGARRAHRRARARGGDPNVPGRHGRRAGRHGQVPPPQGVRGAVRRSVAPRAVPLLRRRPHLLAARRDRPERCRDRQRRPFGGGPGEARRAPRPGRSRRRGSDRGGDRALPRQLPGGGDVLGGPALPGDAVRRTTPRRADRRHPLGGANVARPALVGRHDDHGRAGGARVLLPARSLRGAPGVGRGVGAPTRPRPRAAVRRRERARSPRTCSGPRIWTPPSGRRSSRPPRGTRSSWSRCSRCSWTTGSSRRTSAGDGS